MGVGCTQVFLKQLCVTEDLTLCTAHNQCRLSQGKDINGARFVQKWDTIILLFSCILQLRLIHSRYKSTHLWGQKLSILPINGGGGVHMYIWHSLGVALPQRRHVKLIFHVAIALSFLPYLSKLGLALQKGSSNDPNAGINFIQNHPLPPGQTPGT